MIARSVLILSVLCLFAPVVAAQDPPVSQRDAYVDGWFFETAEGNLEEALKSYRRCVELGGSRDLSAKAIWRMGRIARARGDADAAAALFERAIRDYEGTEGARLAKEDLERGEAEPEAPSAAVAEARGYLHDVLDGVEVAHGRADRVLEVLSPDEIVAIAEERGGDLGDLIKHASLVSTERIFDLVLRDERLVGDAVGKYGLIKRAEAVPDGFIDIAVRRDDGGYARTLAGHLLARGDPASLTQLRRFLSDREPMPRLNVISVLPALTEVASADALAIADLVLRANAEKLSDIATALGGLDLAAENPVSARALDVVFTLPPSGRWQVLGQWGAEHRDRVVLGRFLADGEPAVRRLAAEIMMRTADLQTQQDGFRRYMEEGPPWDLYPIVQGIGIDGGGELPFDHWIDGSSGPLRAGIYAQLARLRGPAIVVRAGLERSDPLLLDALLETTTVSPDVRWRDDPYSRPGFLRESNTRLAEFLDDAARTGEEDLPERLAVAVAGHPDPAVRVGFLLSFPGDYRIPVATLLEPFAADPDVSVRRRLTSMWSRLAPATRASLLTDPHPTVASRALHEVREPDVLAGVVERIFPELHGQLLAKVEQLDDVDLYAAALRAFEPASSHAARCLERAYPKQVELLLWALDHGEGPNPLNRQAMTLIGQLLDDAALARGAEDPAYGPSEWAELVTATRARRADVVEAHRRTEISRMMSAVGGTTPWVVGRTLADLGAREQIDRLAQDPDGPGGRVALYAYIHLGDRSAIDALIDRTSDVGSALFRPLVDAGLAEEAGRVLARCSGDPGVANIRDGGVLVDLLFPVRGDPSPLIAFQAHRDVVVEELVSTRSAERLADLAATHDWREAARGLLEIKAYEIVFDQIGRWPEDAAAEAMRGLRQLTGVPADENARWPTFTAEQDALLQAWRDALLK